MDGKIIYPLIDEKTVMEYNPEHFVTGQGYFFSPRFRTSDIIIENILKGYEKAEGVSITDFFYGKLILRHCFIKDKSLNESLSASINQINRVMGSDLKINSVVAACKDQNSDSVFFVTGSTLYASVRNNNSQKEYYIVSLSDIFVKNNGIDYTSGESLTSDNSFNKDFVDFVNEFKALDMEVNISGCYHPMSEKSMVQCKIYINILIDRCILDGYLTVNEVSKIEMLARLLGISSFDVLEIIAASVKKAKKDGFKEYRKKSVKRAKKLEESSRYLLLHDLIVMDHLGKKKISVEFIPVYTRAYVKYYKFLNINLLEYKRAVFNFIKSSSALKDVLFQGQMLIGDRQICERLPDSVTFQYSIPEQ